MSVTIRSRASIYPSYFWGLTPILWLAFALLTLTFGFGDTFTTSLASQFSGGAEGNPIAAFALGHGILVFAFAKLVVLVVIYSLTRLVLTTNGRTSRRLMTAILFFGAITYAIVSLSNFMAATIGYDLYHYFVH